MKASDPAEAKRPDHVDAAWAMFFAFLGVAAVNLLRYVWPRVPLEGLSLLLQAVFLVAPLAYARGVGLPPFRASGFAPLSLKQVTLVAFASLGTMWLLQGLLVVAFDLFKSAGLEKEIVEQKEQLARSLEATEKKGILFAGFLFVVMSPLCEETLFRGLAFRGLGRRFGVPLAIAITTVVFAAMHQSLLQTPQMIVLGVFFATLVWLTGSVWAGVIAHAANNLAVLVVTEKYGPDVDAFRAPWWMYVLSTLVLGGALALLALDRRSRTSAPA
jgi:membrane protease YdiL (CAAX protease family)